MASGGRPEIVSPSKPISPRTQGLHAADHVHHRRLAGTVRSDQPGDRAAPHLEAGAVDGRKPAEVPRHVLHLEDDGPGIRPSGAGMAPTIGRRFRRPAGGGAAGARRSLSGSTPPGKKRTTAISSRPISTKRSDGRKPGLCTVSSLQSRNVADEARALADDDQHQGADQGAPVVARTAEQHGEPDLEGDDRHELADMDDAERMRPEASRRPAEHAAEHQRLQLRPARCLAERAGGHLVVADRPAAADRRAARPAGRPCRRAPPRSTRTSAR